MIVSIYGKKDRWNEENFYHYNNNKIMLENLQIHNFLEHQKVEVIGLPI